MADLRPITGDDVDSVFYSCTGIPYTDKEKSLWHYIGMKLKFFGTSFYSRQETCGLMGEYVTNLSNGKQQLGKKLRSVEFRKTPSGEELKCYLVIVDAQGSSDVFTFKENIITQKGVALENPVVLQSGRVTIQATYRQVNGGDEVYLNYYVLRVGEVAVLKSVDRHTLPQTRGKVDAVKNLTVEHQEENTPPPPHGPSTGENTPQNADNLHPPPTTSQAENTPQNAGNTPPPHVVESPTTSPPKASPPAETTTVGGGDESADDIVEVTGNDVASVLYSCMGIPYSTAKSAPWHYKALQIMFVGASRYTLQETCGQMGGPGISSLLDGVRKKSSSGWEPPQKLDFFKNARGKECYLVIFKSNESQDIFTFKGNVETQDGKKLLDPQRVEDGSSVELSATYSQVNGDDEVVLNYHIVKRSLRCSLKSVDRRTGAKKTL
eukprot:GHVS01071957.1.p1 GENE.GHVS01071957.1~~GHVS01071957.1.p1  ORF type:complete len:454 (-),score=43.39 GHVS01071957.1:284-1591(-)